MLADTFDSTKPKSYVRAHIDAQGVHALHGDPSCVLYTGIDLLFTSAAHRLPSSVQDWCQGPIPTRAKPRSS